MSLQTFPIKIYNFTNPVGIDVEIGKVQQKLAAVTFIDTIFGRATIQRRQLDQDEVKNRLTQTDGIKGRELYFSYYPQARKLDQDVDVSFSDDYPSFCYFLLRDPINVSPASDKWDFTEAQVQVAQPVSLFFCCDMKKLDPASDQNFSEELKLQLLAVFNTIPRAVVSTLYEGGESILRELSTTQKLLTFTRYPYYSLRIDFVLTYPAFQENGNTGFVPSTYLDPSRTATIPNVNPGNANLS